MKNIIYTYKYTQMLPYLELCAHCQFPFLCALCNSFCLQVNNDKYLSSETVEDKRGHNDGHNSRKID